MSHRSLRSPRARVGALAAATTFALLAGLAQELKNAGVPLLDLCGVLRIGPWRSHLHETFRRSAQVSGLLLAYMAAMMGVCLLATKESELLEV